MRWERHAPATLAGVREHECASVKMSRRLNMMILHVRCCAVVVTCRTRMDSYRACVLSACGTRPSQYVAIAHGAAAGDPRTRSRCPCRAYVHLARRRARARLIKADQVRECLKQSAASIVVFLHSLP